ncbi:MAG: hypothetical protein KIT87_27130 [Anaerolineae bacterium]|nr:hypothetical protein [Anaerolineae bacterium]
MLTPPIKIGARGPAADRRPTPTEECGVPEEGRSARSAHQARLQSVRYSV